MKKNLFSKIVKSKDFVSVMDGGDWNYDRFGFGEVDGKCYRVELEGSESDEDVFELREELHIGNILVMGVSEGFFEKVDEGWYYEMDKEDEMMEWIESLNK
jgi:hypothetical protein